MKAARFFPDPPEVITNNSTLQHEKIVSVAFQSTILIHKASNQIQFLKHETTGTTCTCTHKNL